MEPARKISVNKISWQFKEAGIRRERRKRLLQQMIAAIATILKAVPMMRSQRHAAAALKAVPAARQLPNANRKVVAALKAAPARQLPNANWKVVGVHPVNQEGNSVLALLPASLAFHAKLAAPRIPVRYK